MKDYMKDDWNDFQEVEYIYRDWNTQAYIDTKWKPSWAVWFKEEIWLRFDTSWQRHCFLASWWGSSTYPFSVEVNSWDVSNNRVRFYSENSASSNAAIQFYSSNAISTWEFHDVSITSSWTAVVDWVTTTWSLYSWSNNASDTQLLFIDREFRWSTFNRNHYVSYLKIYENNVLVRDFVPCYRRSDWVIWMFDKVNSIFYTNSGSWTFSKWADVVRERDVTFCEYIQSSGTQYIKTNIPASNTKWVYMRVSSQDIATDLLYFGSRKWTDTRFWIGNSTNSSWNLYLWWNTNDRGVISANTIFEAKLNYLNSRKKEVNDTVILRNIWTLDSSNDVPFYIFAWNDNYSTDSSKYAPSKIKLYSCKISDWNEIIHNFKPCYITATWEAGLWDDIEKKFYWNAWTWSFAWDGTPQYREYSYDFRNKSWTTVQNDWWTLLQWTSWTTINSSWIVMPTRWQWASNKVRIYRSENLSNAKKITLQATYNWSTSDWWNGFDFTTRQSSNFDTWWTSISWWTTTASWYVSRWSASTPNTSVRYGDNPSSWTWTSTAEFDLVNKTITFTRNWLQTLTWTISDADIATIKSGNCFAINWGHDTWTLSVQSIYYKIEY